MASLADLAAVRTVCNLPPEGDDLAADARLTALDAAMSALFEDKCGRSWSADATPLTPRVEAINVRTVRAGILELPPPGILELVSLTVGVTWDGTAYTAGTVADVTQVRPVWQLPNGAYLGLAVASGVYWPWAAGSYVNGTWYGTVLVEALWADQAAGPPPAEVVEAVTFIVAEEYKQERASPESLLGPDEFAVSTRNPWNYERVKGVIAKYQIAQRVTV